MPFVSFSQNIDYAHSVIDTLASPSMFGRGYALKGDVMAADYIAAELEKNHILKKGNSYFQEFTLNANIFPSRMIVKINDVELVPGLQYIVNPHSSTVKGDYKLEVLNSEVLNDEKKYTKFLTKDHSENYIIIDTSGMKNDDFKEDYIEVTDENTLKAAGIITAVDKLTFGAGRYQNDFGHIIIKRDALPENPKTGYLIIDAQFLSNHETKNIFGYIEGQVDTFIVFTAHYDHLGTLGRNVFFPGAHDNASGCAMLLDLAREYSQRKGKPYYGLAFIFFSGEESGLVGSNYFVEHPLIPLKKIKFLLNIDMMGSGEEGVQIVNSTIFTKEYDRMLKINEEYNLMPQIKKRGPAANSDHYYFYEKGVPSFFVYSLGAYKEYHNVTDSRENIPLSGYDSMFKLFMYFVDEINKEARN